MTRIFRSPAWLLPGLVFVLGCEEPPAAAPPPTPTVRVAHPVRKEIVEWNEFTGRLEAVSYVEVRSRVSGYLTEADFKEGQPVDEDDVLMVVDKRPYKAQLNQAKAALKEAEARVTQANAQLAQASAEKETATAQANLARSEFERIEALRRRNSISQSEFEKARNELLTAQANLEAADAGISGANAAIATAEAAIETARAAVEEAELNLEYTEVKAPVDGMVSRRYVTKGNLISGGTEQSTLLTTIVSTDPIYFVFDASEQQVLRFQRMIQAGTQQSARKVRHPAYLALADEQGYPHDGYVDFVDNRFDPQTATLTARAVFRNSDGILMPGLFGKVRIAATPRYEAILVPDAAIGADQAESFVYVLDGQNQVQRRIVETGPLALGLRVIRSGLDTEDRVLLGGLQQVRPGITVDPKLETIPVDDTDLAQYDTTPRRIE